MPAHRKGDPSPTERDIERIGRDYVAGDITDLDPFLSRVSKSTADALESKIRELQGLDEDDPIGPPGPEGWGPDHPDLPPRPTRRVRPIGEPERGDFMGAGEMEEIPPGEAMAPPRPLREREYTPAERKFIESQKEKPVKETLNIDKILFEKRIKRETYVKSDQSQGSRYRNTRSGRFMSKKSVERKMQQAAKNNRQSGKSTIPGGP